MQPSCKPRLLDFVLVPALYFLGARLGVTFTNMSEGISILWPPNGVLLAAFLLFKGQRWTVFALLAISTEILADWSMFRWHEGLLFGCANVLETSVAFTLLSRWNFNVNLQRLSDVVKFVLAGPLTACISSAFIGAAVYVQLRTSDTTFFEFFRIWWFGDALGLMIFTPLCLAFWPMEKTSQKMRDRPTLTDALIILISIGILLTDISSPIDLQIVPVFILPPLLYIAARLSNRWTALCVAIVAVTFVVLTTLGDSPYGESPAKIKVIQIQEFIFFITVMTQGIAAIMAELRHKQDELISTNRRLADLNLTLEDRIKERTDELIKLNEKLSELAQRDGLTGALNRRGFQESAQKEIERAHRHHLPLALIMFDLDHFKNINDKFGHDAGDEVLRHTTSLINEVIRSADTLSRLGGEEFMVVASNTTLPEATLLAERMRAAISTISIATPNGIIKPTASFGVAKVEETDGLEEALRRVDNILYIAKKQGRNCVKTACAEFMS